MHVEMIEYRGDAWEWYLSVSTWDDQASADTPVDLSGMTLRATLKSDLSDEDASAALSSLTEIHSDPTEGETVISFEPSETNLVEPGIYHADVRLYPGPTVIWQGRVEVRQPVTRSIA